VLRDGGSSEHAAGVQWFFKEEIKSHGWYTAALRKAARQFRRSVARERGMDFVVQVAGKLFAGWNLEEKVFAVFLLEKQTQNFGEDEFRLFVSWLRWRRRGGLRGVDSWDAGAAILSRDCSAGESVAR
jgi:hypothetical protein